MHCSDGLVVRLGTWRPTSPGVAYLAPVTNGDPVDATDWPTLPAKCRPLVEPDNYAQQLRAGNARICRVALLAQMRASAALRS